MVRGMAKTFVFALGMTVVLGCGVVTAQDPPSTPPPTSPPPAQPVQQQPPPAQPPAATVPAAPAIAAAATPSVKLSENEARRRREAIFVMEGVFVQHVVLAANATQRGIEAFQPGLRVNMFSPVPPSARGNYLEDYGVFFHVQIPTYIPSVVRIIEDFARNQPVRPPSTDPAQPASLERSPSREAMLDPDAFYVDAVREYLVSAMLEQSKSLDLRPNEWLTVAARGDDGGPSQLSQPSIMVLRIKGSDLMDYLAGRISKEDAAKRIEVKGFSGRR
jgi:hypothetical protein